MTGDILNFIQVIFEHALTTGLIWTGAVVLAVTVTVVGLAFSPAARASSGADADEQDTLLSEAPPRVHRRQPGHSTGTRGRRRDRARG